MWSFFHLRRSNESGPCQGWHWLKQHFILGCSYQRMICRENLSAYLKKKEEKKQHACIFYFTCAMCICVIMQWSNAYICTRYFISFNVKKNAWLFSVHWQIRESEREIKKKSNFAMVCIRNQSGIWMLLSVSVAD